MKTKVVEKIEDRAGSGWCRGLSRSCGLWVMASSYSRGRRDLKYEREFEYRYMIYIEESCELRDLKG